MKQYHLLVRNDLLFTRAALKQENRTRVVTLLIDSGSTYTILSWEVLLSLKLDPATSRTRRPITTANNLEAYDYLLRGRTYYFRYTKETNVQARQMFERALALDPAYADACAFLGFTYWLE
jgi:hypothetical protein